ncbi:hypothetical protein V6N12_065451 [Hibiscus sabdariffa]|uniref:Uncharacterized protein n=1 Tax=Hibiscus sabdariffa TaxID=183260 RepID=A0ABR2G9S1_9ROSI
MRLALRKWFHPRAYPVKATFLTERLPLSNTVHVMPASHRSASILTRFAAVMELMKFSCASSAKTKINIELIYPHQNTHTHHES